MKKKPRKTTATYRRLVSLVSDLSQQVGGYRELAVDLQRKVEAIAKSFESVNAMAQSAKEFADKARKSEADLIANKENARIQLHDRQRKIADNFIQASDRIAGIFVRIGSNGTGYHLYAVPEANQTPVQTDEMLREIREQFITEGLWLPRGEK